MSNVNFNPIISNDELNNIITEVVPIISKTKIPLTLEQKQKNYTRVNEINNNKYSNNAEFKNKKKQQAKDYYNSRKDAFIELQELKKSLVK